MPLKLNSTSGGSVTLQEPATASNRTLTLPDVTATVITDSSGVLNIGSGQVYKDASGNVGIGTTTMTRNQNIGGSGAAVGLSLQNSGTSGRSYSIFSTNNSAAIAGALAIFDDTAGAYRAVIDSSGNLLVGTTSTSKTAQGVHIYTGTADFVRSAGNDCQNFFNSGTGTRVGQIIVNASTTTYSTSSDYRLKEDVLPMTGALAKVAQLKPCTYKWKADGSNGEGFIAHELQAVCPDAVTGEKDAVNEDGSIKPQGIDTSFLVATLTAAIQEQQAMIEELKAKVAALEAK